MGFFIARIPILLFQAIQAALLPKLAALAGAGKHDDFRAGLRKLLVIVVGVGVLGVVAGATIGPIVGEILFGDKFNLGNVDLGLLAAGSAFFILALTLAQALIALLGHGRALVAWCIGLAVCVVVTAFSTDDLFLRVELGFLAGCGTAAAGDGAAAARPPAHGDRPRASAASSKPSSTNRSRSSQERPAATSRVSLRLAAIDEVGRVRAVPGRGSRSTRR